MQETGTCWGQLAAVVFNGQRKIRQRKLLHQAWNGKHGVSNFRAAVLQAYHAATDEEAEDDNGVDDARQDEHESDGVDDSQDERGDDAIDDAHHATDDELQAYHAAADEEAEDDDGVDDARQDERESDGVDDSQDERGDDAIDDAHHATDDELEHRRQAIRLRMNRLVSFFPTVFEEYCCVKSKFSTIIPP